MEVGAGVEVHQQFAGDQYPGLGGRAVVADLPEGGDGPAEGRQHPPHSLLGAPGDVLHAITEHPVRLPGYRLIGTDLPAQLLQDIQHGKGPGRQQHRPCPQHGHAGVNAFGVAGIRGQDGDAFKARAVQSLAKDGGVVGHAAVAAELGHAHGHGPLRVIAFLQRVDQLADDHLAGKADVVVGVLLPHPDLLRAAHRQRHGPDALPVHQGRQKGGYRSGDVGHQHGAQLFVLFSVLDRIGLLQPDRLGLASRLRGAAQLHRLDKGLDPDPQGPGGLALVHLQDQGRLAAPLPQQADDLVGQYGVVAAAEADDLHVLQPRVLRRHHGAGEHPGVEVVGDLHPGPAQVRLPQARQAVHRQHRDTSAGEHPGQVVADQRIRVVGPPCQYHGKTARFFRLFNDRLTGALQLAAEGQNGRFRLMIGPLRLVGGGAAAVHCIAADLAFAVLLRKPVEHRRLKGRGEVSLRVLEVPHHHGIAHDDRADIGAFLLLGLRRHMEDVGQEDPFHALPAQIQHMAVDQLGREADGVRRHVLQAALILLPAAGGGKFHPVAQGSEKRGPEGHAVPELQHPGQSDGLFLFSPHQSEGILPEQQLLPQVHEIGRLSGFLRRRTLSLRHHGAPVAAVAGDIAISVREAQDRAAAVIGAVGADHAALPGVCKPLHRIEADEGRTAAVGVTVGLHLLLDRQRRPQGAHLAGKRGQDHLPPQILLQCPQHGEVAEGAALDHHPVPQLRHIGDPHHLGEHVFDDGPAEPRHQVVRLLAVALLVDDGAVHEHRAPAAQLRRDPGAEGGIRHLVHRHPQVGGEILQERAAAGGACLVEHDIGDHAVFQPDGLHVLAADVQQEGGVREEAAAAPGMGHGLHRMIVGVEGRGEHLFAVAGGAQAQYLQPDAPFPVLLRQIQQPLAYHPQGLALVVGVEGIGHLLVLVHKDELGGGGTGVDPQISPQDAVPHGPLRRLPQFRLVAAQEGVPGLVIGKKRFPGAGGLGGLGRSGIQPLQSLGKGQGIILAGEQLVHGDGGAPGHDGLRVLRADDIRLLQAQPLRKYPHQRGVKGQGTALEDDGGRQFQPLGQAADGLLGDGVERGQRDIRALRPLDQQRLDVGLGKHAAPAGDAVHRLTSGGQFFKVIRRYIQQGGDLINEGAGATRTAAVHPHVGGLEPSGGLVIMEENHLGVLAAQLHGSADVGVQRPDGRRVGHHLLHVMNAQSGGDGTAAGAAYTDPEPRTGKPPGRFFQKLPDGGGLVGIVPLIAGQQDAVVGGIGDHRLDCGGSHVYAKAQDRLICLCHMCSFRGVSGTGHDVRTAVSGAAKTLPCNCLFRIMLAHFDTNFRLFSVKILRFELHFPPNYQGDTAAFFRQNAVVSSKNSEKIHGVLCAL